MVAALLVVSVAASAVIHATVDGQRRARAQAVADLVALAAANDREAAGLVAHRNSATLQSISFHDGTTVVVIDLGGVRSIAAAELAYGH